MKIVAFSGLRDFPAVDGPHASHEVRLLAEGATQLRFGGARGFDALALNAVAEMGLPCVVYVPFTLSDQPVEARHTIVASGARVVELKLAKSRSAYLERTRRMLVGATLLVAATDGRDTGGTHHAMVYARRRHIKVRRIFLTSLARQISLFREDSP